MNIFAAILRFVLGRGQSFARVKGKLILFLAILLCGGCHGDNAADAIIEPATPNTIRAALAFAHSMEASSAQDWPECLKQAEKALQDDPKHNGALMQAAWSCWNLEQYDKGANFYSKVCGSRSNDARLWRAHCYAAAGNWTAAQKAYGERLADAVPVYWAPFYCRARTKRTTLVAR